MPTPPDPSNEHPSTYFMPDRSNEEELTRLQLQDRMATLILGGVLPEQDQPEHLQRILDVACGTGGWLIEVAKAFPTISHLIGVDISKRLIDIARARAKEEQVDKRVEFFQMDALRMLEFPAAYFDLVNQRFAMSYMRTWDWRKLLQEFQRVIRSTGIIRLTESDLTMSSSSPALLRLFQQLAQALTQAGHLFAADEHGIADHLMPLLQQYTRLQSVQTRVLELHYRAEETAGQLFAQNMHHAFHTALPFLQKWTQVPDDYEAIYQRMLYETQQPDFTATVHTVTAWGTQA
ncbi:MAG TPA: class I SAM-dependent methyltransferase [Ktedonobacteraceae bacterium]